MNSFWNVWLAAVIVLSGSGFGSPLEQQQSPINLRLEAVFTIDFEAPEHLARGMADIGRFAVGRKGQVWLYDEKSGERPIYLFDAKGAFVKSFGRKGQGPGEFQIVADMFVDADDHLVIHDISVHKLLTFGADGECLKEARLAGDWGKTIPVKNGQYFVMHGRMDNEKVMTWLALFDQTLREVKALDEVSKPNIYYLPQIEAVFNPLTLAAGTNRVYFGFPGRDAIVRQYDEKGNPMKEIPVGNLKTEPNEKYKSTFKKIVEPIYDMIKDRLIFPKALPPYHSFAVGPNDELAAMTYEWSDREKGYKYNFYSSDGNPIGSAWIDAYFNDAEIFLRVGDRKIYYLREKPSGYKELVVQAIR